MKRKGTYPTWLSTAFKVGLGLLFFAFVYREIAAESALTDKWAYVQTRFDGPSVYYLWLAIVLMPVNIALEALKWQHLMLSVVPISLKRSLSAVVTGITVSLFTPNRIGEFAGRILYLKGRFRVAGIFATFLGSLAQYIIYWIAAWFAIYLASTFLIAQPQWRLVVLLCGALAVAFWLSLYFGSNRVLHWLKRRAWKPRIMRYLAISGRYSKPVLVRVVGLAALRYIVFSFQLYALMLFVGFRPDMQMALQLIPLLFIAQTAIPSFVLTDLGVRGGLAIFIFESWTDSALLAILPSYLLWFLNIIIPAFLGWLSLIRLRMQHVDRPV